MFEALDKVMLAGLGAVTMTQEKAEKLFDEYVKKGQEAKANKNGFIKEVMDNADKTRAELEKLISEQTEKVVSTMKLANKEDVTRLEEKLDKILEQLGK